MSFIIQAKNVHYKYEDGYHALRGVDLTIRRGERIAVMGSNGSGKSTFLLCLNGIRKPFNGQILFDGMAIGYSRKELLALRKHIGIVIQNPDHQMFCADITQEISFGPMNLKLPADKVRADVERIIDELEITPFVSKPTHALSGGQKKQVALAGILVMEPQVILLDEPTASLDPKHTDIVHQHIDRCSEQGMTVIQSTHDVEYAWQWADQVVLFHEGRVLKSGSPEEIFMDESALEMTNLTRPSQLRMFMKLTQKGRLPGNLKPPKTFTQLEDYIDHYL